MPHTLGRLGAALLLVGALGTGCEADPYGRKQAPAPAPASTPAEVKTPTTPPVVAPKAPGDAPVKGVPTAHEDGKPLGKVLPGAALPLVEMLGQEPTKVEALLGPPLPDSKGGMRDACVRYLPERTWFRCKFAWQRYSDKTGTFGVVHVTYEDGKVSGLSFEGIPGSGEFDPRAALRTVGLELPGEPRIENPEMDVTLYSWWNSRARLLINGRQYRVRVSTVGGKWDRAKVEVILNDALNESERARVFEVGKDEPQPAEGFGDGG